MPIGEDKKTVLKRLVKKLHEGADPEKVKDEFKEFLGGVSPTDVAGMEEELIREGLPREEIRLLCDVYLRELELQGVWGQASAAGRRYIKKGRRLEFSLEGESIVWSSGLQILFSGPHILGLCDLDMDICVTARQQVRRLASTRGISPGVQGHSTALAIVSATAISSLASVIPF